VSSTGLSFPAGVAQVPLVLSPSTPALGGNIIKLAIIRIAKDPTKFAVQGAGLAEVQFLPSSIEQAPTFSTWRSLNFPDDPRSDADLAMDNQDGDLLINVFEYLRGTDPTINQGSVQIESISFVDNHLEIITSSLAGISDVLLILEQTKLPGSWEPVNDAFTLSLEARAENQLQRVYRSTLPPVQLPAELFYRIRAVFAK